MKTSFTILAEGEAARSESFREELEQATDAQVEVEEAGLDAHQAAQAIWAFVATHRETLEHLGTDVVAGVASKMIEKLFELGRRRKVSITLLDGYGREVRIQASDQTTLVSAVSAVLTGKRPT